MIKYYTELCPHAVTLYERGKDPDLTRYATGTAAHDILHALAIHPHAKRDEVMDHTCKKLIETGRSGYDAEGPLPPDSVFHGRDLVEEWINWGNDPVINGAEYELGMGFTRTWGLVSYEAGWFSVRPDVIYPLDLDSEEGFGRGICVRDYKTAWNAGPAWLQSTQARCQAVACRIWAQAEAGQGFWEGMNQPDFIRREVVNLRTMGVYHEDTWLDAEGLFEMGQWQTDIATVVDAIGEPDLIDNPARRRPRVGKHCGRCAYHRDCEAWMSSGWSTSDQSIAGDYILSKANVAIHKAHLEEVAAESAVVLESGTHIGFTGVKKSIASEDFVANAWAAWSEGKELSESLVRGFLIAAKLGKAQVTAIAKALYPGKDGRAQREAFIAVNTDIKIERRFKVWDP
jgi:hypothetical protein